MSLFDQLLLLLNKYIYIIMHHAMIIHLYDLTFWITKAYRGEFGFFSDEIYRKSYILKNKTNRFIIDICF